MNINLREMASRFRSLENREDESAWFSTLVPWVAPQAYLNIIFKPAPEKLPSEIAEKWSFPANLTILLGKYNGAILFSGSLSFYGAVEDGRLLDRQDPFSLPPFNIEDANVSWTIDRDRLLVIGGYQYDGSRVCIDRTDGNIHAFKRKRRTPIASWPSLDVWLAGESTRLSGLFDFDGKRTAPESETLPPSSVLDS
jgi:hypothetical protein